MGFLKRIPLYLAVALFAPAVYAAQPLPGGKYASGGPIEITSDTLEVFQQENRAVFMGNVVAIQGEVRLKSDKMTVHYKQAAEGEQKPADQNAIDRIEVEGNVFLTTPEETASGTTGVYDVTNHQIVLNDKVVLTRGKNTLKGEKLVYDFNTGKSVITSANVSTVKDGKGKQRVRALLIPDENKKPAAPAAKPEPKAP